VSARRVPPQRVTERTSAEPAAAPSGPIYIGGLDRSGKTTMRAFLSSHPNIAIPAVGSNMWTYFYGQFGDLGNRSNFERCLQAMIRYKHVRHLDPDPERIRREFAEGPPTYARLFALFLIHYSQRLGKPRWGDQTGLIERYADHLFAANPRARVIHMVRDPRDRYEASLDLWPSGRGRAGGATARWRYSITLGDRNVRRYPHGYRIVRYEDMVLRPEATIREVCAFLGETFYPEMLTMSGALKHRSLLMNGSPRGGTEGPLSAEFIGRHRGRIPSAELAFMQLHARRMMLRYGYRLEPVDLGWTGWARFALLDWPNQLLRMAGWRGREALHQRFPGSFGRKPGHRMILPPIDPSGRVTP
jgi:Sulfotransferase family